MITLVQNSQGVGVGQAVRREDRLQKKKNGEVGRQALQVQEQNLINEDTHNDEDKAHVVVHTDGRGQKDYQGYKQDAEVELLNLEIVLIVTLSDHIKFLSFEDTEQSCSHL